MVKKFSVKKFWGPWTFISLGLMGIGINYFYALPGIVLSYGFFGFGCVVVFAQKNNVKISQKCCEWR